MPDTWGRTLMKRQNSQLAKERGEQARTLHEIDFLLGVYDQSRMGALRFKTEENGPFFRLNLQKMNEIIAEINAATSQWEDIAKNTGIARTEIELMRAAFRVL